MTPDPVVDVPNSLAAAPALCQVLTSLESSDLSLPCEPPMPSWLAQGMMMDDSRRTAAYQMTKSGEGGGVRVGSPLRKGHLVCSFH